MYGSTIYDTSFYGVSRYILHHRTSFFVHTFALLPDREHLVSSGMSREGFYYLALCNANQ